MFKNKKLSLFDLFLIFLGGVILLFIVAPLLGMFFGCSFDSLLGVAKDKEVTGSIWLTLWTSILTTFLFSLLAVPFAYLLARKNFPFKRLLCGIIDIPVVIPHSAAGIAVLGLISRDSIIGSIADKFGLSFVDSPAGIMIAMAFISLPFLINGAREGFEAVPVRLEKVAYTLGASPCRVFLTVSLPLARRGILSGFVMMWARGLSEFGAIVIVAYHPAVTSVLIYERFTAYGLKYAQPVAVLFVLVCLVIFIFFRLLMGNSKRNKNIRYD